jgi:hypothetical protein
MSTVLRRSSPILIKLQLPVFISEQLFALANTKKVLLQLLMNQL